MSGNCVRSTLNTQLDLGSVNVHVLVMGSIRTQPSNVRQPAQPRENPHTSWLLHTLGGKNSRSQLSNFTYTPNGNSLRRISEAGCVPLLETICLSAAEASISMMVPVESCTAHGGSTCVVMRTRMPMWSSTIPGSLLVVAALCTASICL